METVGNTKQAALCTICHQYKPLSCFYLRRDSKNKTTRPWCKECSAAKRHEYKPVRDAWLATYRQANNEKIRTQLRGTHLKRKYGLTEQDYQAKVNEQLGRCAICGDICDKLHIDHDHHTGQVRDLLCGNCNRAIGLLKDSPSVVRRAATYLENWKERVKAA